MARLKSELELSLVDRVSPGARRIERNLENLRNQERRTAEMFNHHRNAMVGTGVAAYALARTLAAPIQASIKFSTQLEDIRQKADMSSEAIERLGRASRDVGLDTAQGAGSITDAVDSMVGSGAVTPDQAVAISTPLGKASTAYTADPTDMANATSAMILQMGLTAEEIEKAYDMMAEGGKLGSFELKDMAAQFPNVLAQANSLGITGEKGLASVIAWLQIARRGTADASSAANNFANFMGKVLAPDSIKNFGEAGVDIVGEMASAAEAGVDPIEHVVGIINGLTDGQRNKLGEFFADTQVTNFLLQATKALEDYRAIRDGALAADGTVEADFQARLATPAGAIARFEASIENLNIAVGNSLVPALADFARSVTPMIDGVASFVDANGELVAAVIEITAALIGLRMLAAAGGMAGALMGVGGAGASAGVGAGAAAAGTGLLAGGAAFLNTFFGKMVGGLAIFEGAKLANSMGVGEGMFDPNKSWDHNVVHALDPTLAGWLYEGDSPLPRIGAQINGVANRTLTGAAESEAMAEIRRLITESENGTTPLHPIELTALREELAALEVEAGNAAQAAGAAIASGIGSQGPAVAAQMSAIMERLRIMAAAGVNIPVQVNGPRALPGASRMIDGPGSFAPPSMPSRLSPGGGNQSTVVNNSFGNINIQNPTNANPKAIANLMGDEVGRSVRAAHSNGAYG